jgi:hypothetical protein
MSDEGISGKAQEVAGQAQEKAQEATAKGQSMVREQVDQRTTKAAEQVTSTAEDLRSVGEELRKQGKETPAKLADRAAERTEQIGDYLSNTDGDKLLSDVEDLGRRQPWMVLGGGLIVGMAAARFLKASSRNRYQGRGASQDVDRQVDGSGAAAPPPPMREPVGLGAGPQAAPQVPVTPNPALGR